MVVVVVSIVAMATLVAPEPTSNAARMTEVGLEEKEDVLDGEK